MAENPRNLPPFQPGEKLKASKLESLRKGVAKRIRGLVGRESATSAATTHRDQSLREPHHVVNNTGAPVKAFSIFSCKKSGEIDYPWGPPIRTEAYQFEAGLQYLTNYDFEIAHTDKYYCELIGELPVRIRYDDTCGVPKIGHPLGPKGDGYLSIDRCGFVVVAEPDVENKTVWVTKSNDQAVRIKLLADIKQNERGDAYVIGELPCVATCEEPSQCTEEQLKECEPDNFKDPNSIANPPQDFFVLRKIVNLTGTILKEGDLLQAHPVLGVGYCILSKRPQQYRVRAASCKEPGEVLEHGVLSVYDLFAGEWVEVSKADNVFIRVQDVYHNVQLVPGESHDVVPTFNDCGYVEWNFIGEFGLFRQVRIEQDIPCFGTGRAEILHCFGGTDCTIYVKNGTQGEEGRRVFYAGEIGYAKYFSSGYPGENNPGCWRLLPSPHEDEWLSTLGQDLCPDQETVNVTEGEALSYCGGNRTPWTQGVATATNLFGLSGKKGLRVLLGAYSGGLFIKQVQHVCKTIAVVEDGCQGFQFLRKGDNKQEDRCAVEGHILEKTSQMFCGEEKWEKQTQDKIAEIYDKLELEYSAGDTVSGSDTIVCDDPKLVLKGRRRLVPVCDNCDEQTPEQESQPGGRKCIGVGYYEWVSKPFQGNEWPFVGQWASIGEACNCANCEAPVPTNNPFSDPDPTAPNPYSVTVPCKCTHVDELHCCAEEESEDSQNAKKCPLETISELELTESTAYYNIGEETVDGKRCRTLIPVSFITFGDCDEGTPDSIFCINPCPEDTASGSGSASP